MTNNHFFFFLQIKEVIFELLSSVKMETTNDILSISVLVGSIADQLEQGSTDVKVSSKFRKLLT